MDEAEEAGGAGPSVLFLHPDLGLGGAERLVVDAALALRARGCRVQIWTAHYDPGRCFAETRGLAVRRAGGWLPRSVCGRGHAVCAALRMAFVALYVLLLSGETCDAFVCDQAKLAQFLQSLIKKRAPEPWSIKSPRNRIHYGVYSKPIVTRSRERDQLFISELCKPFCSMVFHKERTTHQAFCAIFNTQKFRVSACIPVLRLARTRKKVLFYCHFPDQLLTQRESFLKRLYRLPLDWLEEYTTGMADCVVVNSKFTASVFKDTFKSLSHINPDVLYPSLNISSFEEIVPVDIGDLIPKKKKFLFLSINRYERKKNLALALEALHELQGRLDSHEWDEVHLVMAGGYDKRVLENVEHYEELRRLAAKLGVNDHVTFLRSFSDEQKISLFTHSVCVLYTPSNEHFGIVPLEAMYMRCPVIAVNSGGPLESISHNVTGFLCDPLPTQFAEAMEKIVRDPLLKDTMGAAGRVRVMEKFSSEAFSEQLYQYIRRLTE